uniref:Uncharacterized protein n=1 Tax=Sphaerodactylus townsendi TaxID=933632 RepID=A0ACB8ED47_9SAUR
MSLAGKQGPSGARLCKEELPTSRATSTRNGKRRHRRPGRKPGRGAATSPGRTSLGAQEKPVSSSNESPRATEGRLGYRAAPGKDEESLCRDWPGMTFMAATSSSSSVPVPSRSRSRLMEMGKGDGEGSRPATPTPAASPPPVNDRPPLPLPVPLPPLTHYSLMSTMAEARGPAAARPARSGSLPAPSEEERASRAS